MKLLDLIFPKFCVGCHKWGTYLCSSCINHITQNELICPICTRPAIGGAVHPLCKRKCGLDGLWSLGSYRGVMQKAIKKLKYRFVTDLAEVLTNLMIEYWARYEAQFLEEIKKDRGEGWVIVPVPLHPKRQKYRGFNQSALLGQLLSKKLGLGYQDVLKRLRYTKPQAQLSGAERRKNLKNVFALANSSLSSNILLIDDVWTTGSTLKECCYVLKRGGAKKVWAITLAR
ncbi:MAG: ComF family protein [Patescibacteria group bacterium]|nr:ComF family protein [Patescibacteria group bacterium]